MTAGAAGVARAGAGAVGQGVRSVAGRAYVGRPAILCRRAGSGAVCRHGRDALRRQPKRPAATAAASGAPDWAQKLRRDQRMREAATVAAHTVRDGDRPASGENPRLRDDALMFKRSTTTYGDTPEPVTPYQKAAQVWDERIGSARVQARNWRLMAFGCLALTIGLSGGVIWQAGRSTITPYVVEVDTLGDGARCGPGDREL